LQQHIKYTPEIFGNAAIWNLAQKVARDSRNTLLTDELYLRVCQRLNNQNRGWVGEAWQEVDSELVTAIESVQSSQD
jgi:hypothetical protein